MTTLNELRLLITGDSSSAQAAIGGVSTAMRQGMAEMQSATQGLSAGLGSVTNMFAAFATALAGGAAFGAAIGQTVEFADEIDKLKKGFSLSTDAANTLNIAIKTAGFSTDEYLDGMKEINANLKEGENDFNKYGVATRDASGNLLDQKSIMDSAFEVMTRYKEGIDRNLVSIDLFGEEAEEVTRLIRVNSEAMERAAVLREAYDMGISDEDLASTREYKSALYEVSVASQAVGLAIGREVLPLLNDLGDWFKTDGMQATATFIDVIHAAFARLKTIFSEISGGFVFVGKGFVELAGVINGESDKNILTPLHAVDFILERIELSISALKSAFKLLGSYVAEIAATIVLNLQWIGDTAIAVARFDFSKIEEINNQDNAQLKRIQEAAQADREKIISDMVAKDFAIRDRAGAVVERKKISAEQPDRSGLTFEAPEAEKSGQSQDDSKRAAIEILNQQLELLSAQNDRELKGSLERVEIARRAAAMIGATYGLQSKEHIRALRTVEDAEREHAALLQQFASMQANLEKSIVDKQIAGKQEILRFNQEMEIMSVREVMQAKQAMEEQSFQNTMRAMEAELAMKRQGSAEQIKMQNDIKLAILDHNLAIQKSNNDLARQASSEFRAMVAPIQTAIGSSLSGIVTGQTTLMKVTNTMLSSMLDNFTGFLAKEFSLWAENQLAKTALGKAFGLVHVADQAAESAAINAAKATEGVAAAATEGVKATAAAGGLGVQAATSGSSIMMSAWTGMANAYAAISAIPVVGPFIAPAVAAGVFVTIASMAKNLFSAEGGFDVPAGINPVTQLHEREMVLPRAQADAVRNMAKGGGTGGGVTINVSAIDTRGFESWLHANAHTLAPSLRRVARNAVSGTR